jgi:hypothetical protein
MLPSSVANFNPRRFHVYPPPGGCRLPLHPSCQDLRPSRSSVRPTILELLHPNLQQAKKRLIATHAKLEIFPTHSKYRASPFLIATKMTVHPLPTSLHPCLSLADSDRQWPRRATHVRIHTRLLLLKILLGDMPGLQDRACSLFSLAGPK